MFAMRPNCLDLRKVRTLASDGGSGARRALFHSARQYFPDVHFVIEDPAHGLRIATVTSIVPSANADEIQQQPLTEKSQSREAVPPITLHARRDYTLRAIDRKPRLPCGRTPPIHRMCLIAGDGKHRELIVLFDEEEGGRIQICSIPENAEAGGPDYILEIKAAEEEATQRFDCLVEKCVGLRMVAQ